MRNITAASMRLQISGRNLCRRHAVAVVASCCKKTMHSQAFANSESRGQRGRDERDKHAPLVSRDRLWKDGIDYDIDETGSMYLKNKKPRRKDDDDVSSLEFMRRHFKKKGLRNRSRRPSADPIFVPKLKAENGGGNLFQLDETWETIKLRMRTYNVENKYDSVFRLANAIVKAGMIPPMWIYSEVVSAMVRVGGKGGFLAPTIMSLVDELLLRGKSFNRHMFHQLFKLVAKSPDPTVRHRVLRLAETQACELAGTDWLRMVQGYLVSNEFEMAIRTVDKLKEQNISLPYSTYMILVDHLLTMGEVDLAYQYLSDRMEKSQLPDEEQWGRLLSLAARDFRYDLVPQIWADVVELDYVVPDDGTCINVVLTATRHADPGLCASALRILVARGVRSEFLTSCLATAYESRRQLEPELYGESSIGEQEGVEGQAEGSTMHQVDSRLPRGLSDWE
ncbi:hypothetical protein V1525DRAFT_387800 [Lipomyces kononenkoae]|uniref:Uncharacterized protein n=1 Tax=Lipomyces kononenkoae TaxID=34357 RepID=A0ACC3T2X4_LIPKO